MKDFDPVTVYESAKAAFVQSPDDNPDCVPFYRAWAGVRAVCDVAGIDLSPAHHLVHQALGWSDNGRTWELFTAQLSREIAGLPYPAQPVQLGFYESAPASPDDAEAVETLARSLFNDQFKRAFPGKRVNSKLAGEHWTRLQGQARDMARERLADAHRAWSVRKLAHEAREAEKQATWTARVDELDVIGQTAYSIAQLA